MQLTLRDFQKKNCLSFLEKLFNLRSRISDVRDLRNKLGDLHTAFLRIKNSFAIKKYKIKSIERQSQENGIDEYRVISNAENSKEFIVLGINKKIIGLGAGAFVCE